MPGYQNITAKRRIVFAKKRPPIELYTKALWREFGIHAQKSDESVFSRTCAGKRHLKSRERGDRKGVNGGENRGIHGRDPCRLTWAISGDFRLVVLGILLYSCVLRTKTRSKIAPWQVQRSFARRICAKAMKSPQTIRRYWQGL